MQTLILYYTLYCVHGNNNCICVGVCTCVSVYFVTHKHKGIKKIMPPSGVLELLVELL